MPEHLNGAKDLDRGRLESRTDRYVALPEKTRIYIESLHDDDVVRLALLTDLLREKGGVDRDGRPSIAKVRRGIEMAEAAELAGRWTKWLIIAAGAIAGGIVSLLALLDKLRSYLPHSGSGGPHP
jgi:hypothetical protein